MGRYYVITMKPILSLGRFSRSLISTGGKLFLGLGVMAVPLLGLTSVAQNTPGDIVVVGNSPTQWGMNQAMWNQLLNLSGAGPMAASPDALGPNEEDPKVIEQRLLQNIRVGRPSLQPVIKLPGSSEVVGSVTNSNREPVTIQSINFEVLARDGSILQTGSAIPEPATLGAGQTATYQRFLPTVPSDVGATVRLINPSVIIQGGV